MRPGSNPSDNPDSRDSSDPELVSEISSLHTWSKRLVIALFGILAALIVFEIGFRIVNVAVPKAPRWADRPRHYYLPEVSHKRDRIYAIAKPADVFRIIVVGDSFTEAGENQYDDSFSKRLERMLNLNKEQRRVEVLNWGKPGSSTAHEMLLLRKAVASYAPDLIVLQITLNDPELAPYRVAHDIEKPSRETASWLDYWKSLTFLITRISNSQSRRDYVRYYFDLFEKPATWQHFSNAVKDIQGLTATAKIPLMAVLFPLFSHPLNETYPFSPLHQKVTSFLDTLAVKNLDLFSAYKNIPFDRLQVRPGKDSHPNEIAHRIASDSIYEALLNFNLIPEDARIKNYYRKRDALAHIK